MFGEVDGSVACKQVDLEYMPSTLAASNLFEALQSGKISSYFFGMSVVFFGISYCVTFGEVAKPVVAK